MSQGRQGPHLDSVTVDAYAAQLMDVSAEACIEQHLLSCMTCRALLAADAAAGKLAGVEPGRMNAVWTDVIAALEPQPTPAPAARHRLRGIGVRFQRWLEGLKWPSANDFVRLCRNVTATLLVVVVAFPAATKQFTASDDRSNNDAPSDSVGVAAGSRTAPFTGSQPQIRCGNSGVDAASCDPGQGAQTARMCSPDEVRLQLTWRPADDGLDGEFLVINTSDDVCGIPAVPDIAPLDINGFRLTGTPRGTDPSAEQAGLPAGRSAKSNIIWQSWCGAPVGSTVRVEWPNGAVDVAVSGPLAPGCPAGVASTVPIAGQLHIIRTVAGGIKPV